MKQDNIEIRRHEADAIQAEAELRRMDAEARRNDAKKKIDNELGLSKKRSEFKNRLDGLRNSAKSDFNSLMDQYRTDWEAFKSDVKKSYGKADRVGNAQLDLIVARIDGLGARIQYLIGQQTQDNADEAAAIKQGLEAVAKNIREMDDEISRAFDEEEAIEQKELVDYDQQLQAYTEQVEQVIASKGGARVTGNRHH